MLVFGSCSFGEKTKLDTDSGTESNKNNSHNSYNKNTSNCI